MGLKIVIDDLTNIKLDAIINPVDTSLIPSGGLDLKIHQLVGKNLFTSIEHKAPLNVADNFMIKTDHQNFKSVIFISVPTYSLNRMVERMLYICYMNVFKIALEHHVQTIGFPLLSSGAKGFPKDIALNIATQAIQDFLTDNQMDIYLSLYDEASVDLLKQDKYKSLLTYLESNEEDSLKRETLSAFNLQKASIINDLQDQILTPELSFSYYLFELIEKKGINEVELYKKANIDRKLFSKIMSSGSYQPSKQTAILLALALELNIDQTLDLLSRAGYTLSNALKSDLVIRWCVNEKIYNVYEVCEILLKLELKPLF